MTLPADHPKRIELNDEIHARAPEPLSVPARLSYVAILCDADGCKAGWTSVRALCRRYGVEPAEPVAAHYAADLGQFRLNWECHGEFFRLGFIAAGEMGDDFGQPALSLLPRDWIAGLPGQIVVAAHVALIAGEPGPIDATAITARWFAGNQVIGAAVSGGAALALTDARIHPDGFSRHLLLDYGTTPWQAGRLAQRLLEIDTYRLMALLAFPVARAAAAPLAAAERELAGVTAALVSAGTVDEAKLLDRLTLLQADIEHRVSDTRHRFDAADAYYELVQHRIIDLREERIAGLQTWAEFTDRRLAPAMNTCRSLARRQESLSRRVSRANKLLATRVNLTLEQQNQALLESMNRRARLQVRMQSTVEGLLVAAVTYYVCGLVGRAAEALLTAGVHVRPEMATGISIPIVGLVAWLGMNHVRRAVTPPIDA
jgi:uncharacterized membrane-anchored protein